MKTKFSQITFSVGEVAKMTNFPGGEIKLFAWLRKHRFLLQNNQPSDFQVAREWFVLVSNKDFLNKGRRDVPVTRVTSKGLSGLEKLINRCFPICKPCKQ